MRYETRERNVTFKELEIQILQEVDDDVVFFSGTTRNDGAVRKVCLNLSVCFVFFF